MSAAGALPRATAPIFDPYKLGRGRESPAAGQATAHGLAGPASKWVVVGFGFWVFILSDVVMFSAFFAAHSVLLTATAGGPSGAELFHWPRIAIETACLLASSFACGLSAVATSVRSQLWTRLTLLATGLLGLAFVVLESLDFAGMVGAAPDPTAAHSYRRSSLWWAATACTSALGCFGWAR